MKKYAAYIICFFLSFSLQANSVIDSLENLIENSSDTTKIKAILALGEKYQASDFNKSLKYAQEALALSNKQQYSFGIGMAHSYIGYSLTDLGKYNEAIDNYEEAIKIFIEIGEQNGEAIAYNDMAYIYQSQGLIENAIGTYVKSLKLLEKLNDKGSEAACLNNIGLLYHDQNNFEKALEYYLKSLKLKEGLGNEKSIATSLNNIGSLYYSNQQYIEAEEYFFKSLAKRKKTNDKHGIAQSLTNLSGVNREQKKYDIALEYLIKAEKIQLEINDKIGLANTFNSLGENYRLKKDTKQALKYLKKAYSYSKEIGSPLLIKNSAITLSSVYCDLKEYKKAYPLLSEHYRMADTLENTNNTRQLTQIGLQYEFEKKLHENELVQIQESHKHEIDMKEQKIMTYSFATGLVALIILSIVILKSLNDKKKAHLRITQQKLEIEEKSHKLEEALTDITDSVIYAKRIQSAILPPSKRVKKHLPESFILYKPKDIVAGDFYWLEQKNNSILFAAADCTGHGVPGAMVSVVCNNGLNRSVREHGLIEPGKILDKTREIVIEEFEKSDDAVQDGMDIALCSLTDKTLQYAGAHNPLWIIRNGEIIEVKANKQPIGQFDKLEPYTTHTIQLEHKDSIYIFSDGYVDQFGGEKGKKFKSKSFKSLLLSIQDQPMEEQKKIIDATFEKWKGSLEQIDDVCVIGVKI